MLLHLSKLEYKKMFISENQVVLYLIITVTVKKKILRIFKFAVEPLWMEVLTELH